MGLLPAPLTNSQETRETLLSPQLTNTMLKRVDETVRSLRYSQQEHGAWCTVTWVS